MEKHKATEAMSEGLTQLISFTVGDEDYGVNIQTVKEVIRKRDITKLPKAPTFVKGVINLRGDVIPIIDLREKFGIEHREYTNMTRVIVVEIDGKSIGMVVDSVSHVTRIEKDQIEPPPPCVGKGSEEFIMGVGKIAEKLIVMLNISNILTTGEKIELDNYKGQLAS